VSLRQLD